MRSIVLTVILGSMWAGMAAAGDSLTAVMQRMRSNQAVRIAYQETRHLLLMEQPWHGKGFLYSMPPDLMIKEQIKPERLLMGIEGMQMYYFDPATDTRHRSELDDDNPLSPNIAVFRALVNGDLNLLYRLYRVKFTSDAKTWRMTLRPWQSQNGGLTIEISGLTGQQANAITIADLEGDRSDFSLQPDQSGRDQEMTARRLFQELMGD